jgi:hypothetical protein
MDYAYSPIQTINTQQRIKEPKIIVKPYLGKRIIKYDYRKEDKNINRVNKKFIKL